MCPRRRPQVFALFGFIIIVAPATGPVLGGWLTDAFSWHWIFLINLPVGLIAFTLTSIFMSRAESAARGAHGAARKAGFTLDYVGLTLVAIGFGSLQMFLDKFEVDDGFSSQFIVSSFAIAGHRSVLPRGMGVAAPASGDEFPPAVQPQFRHHLLRHVSLISFCFLSSTQLLPQMAQTLLGYTSQTSGLSLALGGIVTLTFMPIAAFVTGRIVPPRFLMAGGLIQMGVALISDSHFSPYMSFDQLTMARVMQVFAMPFIFIPMSASSFIGVEPQIIWRCRGFVQPNA